MGQKELIDSLKRKCEEQIDAIQKQAEREAEEIKAEYSSRLNGEMDQHTKLQKSAADEEINKINLQTERQVRLLRIAVKGVIDNRLYQLTRQLLGDLRKEGYEGFLRVLAGEIPAAEWQQMRVNPADVKLVAKIYPDVEIVADEAIVGGIIAISENGRLRIDNSLEKRLERCWGLMLPCIIKEIEKEVKDSVSTT